MITSSMLHTLESNIKDVNTLLLIITSDIYIQVGIEINGLSAANHQGTVSKIIKIIQHFSKVLILFHISSVVHIMHYSHKYLKRLIMHM